MSRMDYELIAAYAGRYGHYEIRRKSGLWSDDYYIYKDMKHWKNASNPQNAVDIIKKYDPTAKQV